MKADIINLSFGFDNTNNEVDVALQSAKKNNILVFAAMSNEGIYRKPAWPARAARDAIGIHSCTHDGKTSSGFTPMPIGDGNKDFMVVGENIPAHWLTAKGGGFRIVEGTSFATPVAVAMAALIVAFVNQVRRPCWTIREESELKIRLETLWENGGMIKVLELASQKTSDNYSWISPNLLWRTFPEDDEPDTVETSRAHGWKIIRRALRR
jgi:subtilisin family serine protease